MSWSIIIGNGFSIDATNHSKVSFNPSYPWDWPIKNPYNQNENLLNVMPHLQEHLKKQGDIATLEVYQALKDIVKDSIHSPVLKPHEHPSENDFIHIEACHYLRFAYAWWSEQITNEMLKDWKWLEWFKSNSHEIETILSYNYDTILEKTMRMSEVGIVYESSNQNPLFPPHEIEVYYDTNENDKKIVHIAKHHGSSNFTSWVIREVIIEGIVQPLYPIQQTFAVRGSPLKILTSSNIFKPTGTADLVLPGEWTCWKAGHSTEVSWAIEQKQHFINESKSSDKLLIVGFSNSEPDQPEFEDLVSNLTPFDDIHIVDPSPSRELIKCVSKICKNKTYTHPSTIS